MALTITCTECGKDFKLTDGEQAFYLRKGYFYPRRCKKCRDNDTGARIGLKSTSFYRHPEMVVMWARVNEGRPSVAHYYIVQLNQEAKRYIYYDHNSKTIHEVCDVYKASGFRNKEEAQRFADSLHEKYKKDYKVIPIGYWGDPDDERKGIVES